MGFNNGHFTTGQSSAVLWASSQAFRAGDIVTFNNVQYRCTTNHTSTSDFRVDWQVSKYWISYSANYDYCTNGNAEQNTAGWLTYADGAAIPVDGVGGSPSLTWAASNVAPLYGNFNFLLTPGALGNGVAYDFDIEAKDQAKVLSIPFEVAVGTPGSYTEGDVQVWLYDKTNAQIIQPTGYRVQKTQSGSIKQVATFQTNSNSTSYRVLFHQATAASGYTLKIDNFQIIPQTVAQGTPVTDLQAYTLTIGATTTPPTKATTKIWDLATWSRCGDSMILNYEYRHVNNTGATNGSGTYLFPLPPGYSIDTAKMNVNSTVGANIVGPCVTDFAGTVRDAFVKAYSATQLAIVFENAGTDGTILASAVGTVFTAASFGISYTARVPILGWSSQVQMSSDTDTRVVDAVYNISGATATPTLTNGSTQIIDYNIKIKDSHNAVTTGSGWVFTVPVAGDYDVSSYCQLNVVTATSVNNGATLSVYKNGSLISQIGGFRWQITSAGIVCSMSGSYIVPNCNAGDTINVRVTQSSGNSTTVSTGGSGTDQVISIKRLSGPSQIAANETVACKYQNTAGTSLTSSTINVPFATKIYDSHGAFNGATGTFTAPVAGKYQVSVALHTQNVSMSTTQVMELFFRNTSVPEGTSGQQDALDFCFGNAAGHIHTVKGVRTYSLNAGDIVEIRADISVTVNLNTSAGYNIVCVEKVG